MLTNTASIGNAVLKSAMYLRKNYAYTVENTTGNGYTKKYVNERNRFGERHLLKKNALLLFIYLHFLNPDKNGFICMDIEDAAEAFDCSERTVKNNLHLLHRHNYISLSHMSGIPGYYCLFLSEYKSYI